jgi:hypothetical protein
VDPGETPEELVAIAAVFTGFALLLAAVGTAAVRTREASEMERIDEAAVRLLDAFLEVPELRLGGCLSAAALNGTVNLDALSPSRSYDVRVSDVVLGIGWGFGPGTRGDYRVAFGAACVAHGDTVTPARVVAAVGQ